MKKVNMLKKILSFSLALALFLTSPASVFAVDAEVPTVEAAAENNEGEEEANLVSDTLPTPTGEGEASEVQSEPEETSDEAELNNNGLAGVTDLGLEKTEGETEKDEDADELAEDELEADDADTEEEEEDEIISIDGSGDGVTVTVSGLKSVIGDAEKVSVEKIERGSEYKNVEKALEADAEKENKELVGFVVYDIKLVNANGDTIEPDGDKVRVTINKVETPDEVAVEDTQVSVAHFAGEDNSTNITEKMESVSPEYGNDPSTVDVTFETESFSYYSVQWTRVNANTIRGKITWAAWGIDGVVNLYIVDENGDEIQSAEGYANHTIDIDTELSADSANSDAFENLANKYFKVDGYTYKAARIKNGNSFSQIYNLRYNWDWYYLSYYWDCKTINRNNIVSNWTDISAPGSVYLTYEKIKPLYDGVYGKAISNIGYSTNNNTYNYSGNKLRIEYYVKQGNNYEKVVQTPNGNNATFTFDKNEVEISLEENDYKIVNVFLNEGPWSGTALSPSSQDDTHKTFRINTYKTSGTDNCLRVVVQKGGEIRNVKVDLFDYEADNNMVTTPYYFTDSNFGGINSVSLSKDSTKPGLLFVSGGLEGNKSDPDFLNKYRADSASYVNKDGATPGIADEKLTLKRNGKITFSNYAVDDLFGSNQSKTNNRTIDYDSKGNAYKWGFYDVEFPFIEKDGYLEFDSSQYNAVFNVDENKVEISEQNNGQFWPMDSLKNGAKNPHFGMHITSNFTIPDEKDYSFYFSGDDDVWVYIDGELVLDIGGIHGVVEGNIDFKNATSTVGLKDSANKTTKNIKNYVDGKIHEIQFYYLERGDNNSNCVIRFNMDVPTDEQLNANVEFVKNGDDGKPLKDAEFKLSGSGKTARSDAEGKVSFADIPVGEYTLEETSAPKGYKKSNQKWTVVVEAYKTGAKYDIYPADGKEDNFKVENGQFVIVNTKDTYEKTLTIEKKWVGDTADKRPASVTFEVYGTYEHDGKVEFVAKNGSKIVEAKEPFEVTLTADDKKSDTEPDIWVKTLTHIPVLVNNELKQVITWNVKEKDVVSGYTVKYAETEFGEDIKTEEVVTIPGASPNPGTTTYNHIDVEVWTANEQGETTTRKITGIKDSEDHPNKITIIGYKNSNTWVKDPKNTSTTLNSNDDYNEYRATGISVTNNTKIAFKVEFDNSSVYKLVVLTNEDTYPEGTLIRREDCGTIENYEKLCENLGFPKTEPSIDLGNKKIFEIAEKSCPNHGNNQGGLDFVLTPKTIDKYTVTKKTGNELHKVTNIKSASLTLNKTATASDYDKRIYKLDLSADYNGLQLVPSEKPVEKNADVVLVIDASGSMTFIDSAIVSENTRKAAFDRLDSLDKNKIYFTSTTDYPESNNYGYGPGRSVTPGAQSRLSPGLKNGSKWYALPDDGDYIFYNQEEKCWYKKGIWDDTNNRYYNLEYLSWNVKDNNSKIDKITVYNCPTTIYTDRSELIINAAEKLLDELTDNSKVAVVTFGNESTTKIGLSSINNNSNTIKKAINEAYGVYYQGTNMVKGLSAAKTILENDNSVNAKYVLFFTDGDNTGNAVDTTANQLKNLATVYAVGTGVSKDTLTKIATEGHVIEATNVSAVAKTFSEIGKEITSELLPKTGKGTITDVIDSRFILTDVNGTPINADASVGTNGTLVVEDGIQKVVWNNVEIGTGDNRWSDSIYVKAKDTFLGGNKVTTNDLSSSVSIDGDMTEHFPQPTVNVKLLDYSLTNKSITLWQGDTIDTPTYVAGLIDGRDIPNVLDSVALTDEEIETLKSGSVVEKEYIALGENLGKFTYTLTLKDKDNAPVENVEHEAEVVGEAVETYVLTIEYTPVSVADRNKIDAIKDLPAPVGTEVTTVTPATGTYTVNVITGALDVTKRSKTENGTALGGATYKLQKRNNNQWSDVATLTSSSDTATLGKLHLDNLGVGEYRLTETSAPSAYALSNDEFIINVTRNEQETTKVLYNVTVTKNGTLVETWSVDPTENAIEDTIKDNLYTCEFTNGVVKTSFNAVDQILYTLPETGGRGVYVYTIGGVLLMLGACLLLYKNKKNKNK